MSLRQKIRKHNNALIPLQNEKNVFNSDNENIGTVTSGSMSPSLNKAIGLAYINIDESNIGNNILVQVRNKFLDATIVKIPFL